MIHLARLLISSRGEASGVAIATDLLALYAAASSAEKATFIEELAANFGPDPGPLHEAWLRYRREGPAFLPALAAAVEPPRQELFRRLNSAPGGTAALVALRKDLLELGGQHGAPLVDHDLTHLLQSWFNRGFLALQPISWASPASLLERVIRYEAVHDIRDWADLRRRLDPPDRRCFAFFHPAMPNEPLIFVEVALTRDVPDSIQTVLSPDREPLDARTADTAVFYSISNCQPGLRGISLGPFLIRQVAVDLKRELPNLEAFVTLSPMPGLMHWLLGEARDLAVAAMETRPPESLRKALLDQAIRYLLEAKTAEGRPLDPVARFHLGNGARLERLNWMADATRKGLAQSGGMMVNYRYDLPAIEELHEAYAHQGAIAIGEPFQRLVRELKPARQKWMERQE